MNKSEASRQNGAQSRGPVTPEGKQKSSQNSLKHGLHSKAVVLANESQEEYDALLFDYMRLYLPVGAIEIDLVHEIAANRWRLRRCVRLEAAALDQAMTLAAESEEPGNLEAFVVAHTMGRGGALLHLNRYETRLRRSCERADTELRRIQADRLASQERMPAPDPAAAHPRNVQNEPMDYVEVYARSAANRVEPPAHSAAAFQSSTNQAGETHHPVSPGL